MTLPAAFVTIFVLSMVATLGLRVTTHYLVEADRLLMRRAGLIWMTILFRDVEEIELRSGVFDRLLQIRMYRLGRGWKILRITKRRGFRYVLINPRDPSLIIASFRRFRASLPSEVPMPSGSALPDFLRPTR